MFESDVEEFLEVIEEIKHRIEYLLEKSSLAEEEKRFILDHILFVPGPDQHHLRNESRPFMKYPGEAVAND